MEKRLAHAHDPRSRQVIVCDAAKVLAVGSLTRAAGRSSAGHPAREIVMIRTILGVIIAAVFLIVTLPVLGIEYLIRKKWPHFGERSSFRIVQAAFRLVKLPLGIKVTTIGLENIPKDEPVLFICNHRSYLDVILTYPQLPPITGFVAKNDFRKIPILPIWMDRLYCEFLVKDDIRQNLTAISNAIDHVKHGVSMYIYPEGQRSKGPDERELLPFHEGSFKIATRTKCKIVPVAICGTRERWETQFPKVKPGHVIVEYGKPIDVASMSREELKGIGEKTRAIVQEMVIRNHEKL